MALTLTEHFSYSKLETLVIRGGAGSDGIGTNGLYTCVFNCSKYIKLPPAEIVSIKAIRQTSLRGEY
jgi:hypothetical protein